MGRPPNTDERRAQIMTGLMAVTARRGLAGATTAAIAEAAGLTPGLVHYHWRRKRDVLLALVEHLAAKLVARAEGDDLDEEAARVGPARHAEHVGPAARQLRRWLLATSATGPGEDRDAVACWVEVLAAAGHDEEVRAVVEEGLRSLRHGLETRLGAAMAERRGRPASPDEVRLGAAALLSTLVGGFLLGRAVPAEVPAGFLSPLLLRLSESLLEGEAGGGQPLRAEIGSAS